MYDENKYLYVGLRNQLLYEFLDIVYRVMDGGPIPFRPDTGSLKCEKYVIDCMVECWSELPEDRPDFRFIYKTLHKMREGM